MKNFLRETRQEIEGIGRRIDEIVFIGSRDGEYECSWDEFSVLADHDYDNGFGCSK